MEFWSFDLTCALMTAKWGALRLATAQRLVSRGQSSMYVISMSPFVIAYTGKLTSLSVHSGFLTRSSFRFVKFLYRPRNVDSASVN